MFFLLLEKRQEEELKYQREIERERERQKQLNQQSKKQQNGPVLKIADFEDYEPEDSFENREQEEEDELYDQNADSEEDGEQYESEEVKPKPKYGIVDNRKPEPKKSPGKPSKLQNLSSEYLNNLELRKSRILEMSREEVLDEYKVEEKEDLELQSRVKGSRLDQQTMNLSKNIREYQAKQKSEIMLDHEISELKAEIEKIDEKISSKKDGGDNKSSKHLGSKFGAKEIQEELKSKNLEIEKLKSAYSSLLGKWQTGVETKEELRS